MAHRSNLYIRQAARRSIRKVLIVCEGKNTEPQYFKGFKTREDLIRVEVHGAGRVKYSLVEHAVKLKKEAELKNETYSVVWCVLDRDSHPDDPNDKDSFNRAIFHAGKNQIRVAYSNDAFEIWYILHYNYHQTSWHRDSYEHKLTKLLGCKYEKTSTDMYKILKEKQTTAIKNAKQLLEFYGANHNPESDNPSTTVHILVEFLNNYLENEE